MHEERDDALRMLAKLGFRGLDVYLAELMPAVEMAWADGVIQPNERAVLEAYCESLVEELNRQAGAPFFSLRRALRMLDRATARRLPPSQRREALVALKQLAGISPRGAEICARMVTWAEAVAAVDGRPVWDTRELFWLQFMKRNLGLA
ncbi:MAG: hypothetical protein DI536_18455 [Archangium gephyra]|uniref:Uncharacterized protein n=1 Tax=Archangium gephyra TaxID=48 RepID=A0A2W5T6H2_9BACT|nr:MAG: hypothetical protein DI536_18455 [Archangium gephyra]